MARGRVFLILGVVLALIAGLAVYLISSQAQPKAERKEAVVVALTDIPARTYITATNAKTLFTVAQWPVSIVPPGALPNTAATINKVVVERLAKGTPVLAANLSTSATSGQTGLSIDIPHGFVAESVAISDTNAVAGAIAPGDYVDILLSEPYVRPTPVPSATPGRGPTPSRGPTPRPTTTVAEAGAAPSGAAGSRTLITQLTLQHVKVLAVGTRLSAQGSKTQPPPTSGGAATMTLLLTPQEALVVKQLKDSGNQYDVVLRRYDDSKTDYRTTAVTQAYIDTLYHIVPGAAPTATATPKATATPTVRSGATPSGTPKAP